MADIGLREYAVHLRQVPAELERRLHQLLLDVADEGEQRTRQTIMQRLTARSRSLLTSVRVDVVDDQGGIKVTWAVGGDYQGLRVRYARIQEEGGVVKPVRGRLLAIPQAPALTGPGINKYPEVRRAPHLYFQPTKNGGLLINRHTGEVWYVLVPKVTIKAKHYLRDSISETVKGLADRIDGAVVDVVAVH